jgi:hypothetical protein
MNASTHSIPPSRPLLERLVIREWEYRRPRLAMGIRIASGIFNFLLAIVLFAAISPPGPLSALAALPLAGSAALFWTVYRLQASVQS